MTRAAIDRYCWFCGAVVAESEVAEIGLEKFVVDGARARASSQRLRFEVDQRTGRTTSSSCEAAGLGLDQFSVRSRAKAGCATTGVASSVDGAAALISPIDEVLVLRGRVIVRCVGGARARSGSTAVRIVSVAGFPCR